jgi:hypothetical protein
MKCDELRQSIDFIMPDVDIKGNPQLKAVDNISNSQLQNATQQLQQLIIDKVEHYYNVECDSTIKHSVLEWYPSGYKEPKFKSENSEYLREKWVKVRDNDFTCVIMLNDYQDTPPIDDDYEIYGGKIEFPQHGFGFNNKVGTLVVFPSGPHFINAVAPVNMGNLKIAKFYVKTKSLYLYQPSDFPGDYTNWF